jgi:DNA-binding CsgD family transcriptional regulator
MISRVSGSLWIPQVLAVEGGVDPEEDHFRRYIENVQIPLDHMLLETETVRRRRPALVTDPSGDPRTFKEMVGVARSPSYVTAPIMPTGRVIGFFHADRFGSGKPVTTDDRDAVWTFAEHFGLIFQRAVLARRLATQRAELVRAFTSAEAVIQDLGRAEIELARREPDRTLAADAAAILTRPATWRLTGLLSAREREVLELMAAGATNARIATLLVISQGTVKSHVKQILRKLRASNRAEAVARFLQLALRERAVGT